MSEHHVYFCATSVVACRSCANTHGKSFGKQFARAAMLKIKSECTCPEGFAGVMESEPPAARKNLSVDSERYQQFTACVDLLLIADEPLSTQQLRVMVAQSECGWVASMSEVVNEMMRWFDVECIEVKAQDAASGEVSVMQYWRLHSKKKVEVPVAEG